MQLAPSLHRIGSSSLVNSYIVEDAGLLTVVDAGLAGQWNDLLGELKRLGRSLTDIRALLLTHGDIDHIGFAERLRRDHGVPVWISDLDAPEAMAPRQDKPTNGRDPMRIVPMLQFAVFGLLHDGLRRTPLTEVERFAPHTVLNVPGAPRVIAMPGHTPGSVAFHFPSVDALFMGDAMTTRSVTTGRVGPALGPFTVDRRQALASLDSLEQVTARWVLPGHGDPWTGGVPEAVRRIRTSVSS
jgi:glyoxylase-like metal-dependent hydrolase (beta-lactamase superfamily II)